MSPAKNAPANRRPAGQSDGLERFVSDHCRRSASPAVVAGSQRAFRTARGRIVAAPSAAPCRG